MLDQLVNAVRKHTIGKRSTWGGGNKKLVEHVPVEDDENNLSSDSFSLDQGLLTQHKHVTRAELDSDWGIKVILPEEEMDDLYNVNSQRNNREEIRRKLAMGSDNEEIYRRPRRSKFHSKLQSGMNLQICFMNETAKDSEVFNDYLNGESIQKSVDYLLAQQNVVPNSSTSEKAECVGESGSLFSRQARLQAEARVALAQAKQMARMQMEVERQKKKKSIITEIIGIPFSDGKYQLSRHALSEMNLAQLQIIVNDLHTQIENFNDDLVRLLLERDSLHMEQDSKLVDIEDLTRQM